jgi:carbamoyltransferase
MNIVGIHFNTHESGAAVLHDGALVCALSQERLDRQKMSDATPAEALWTALDDAGLSPADVDHLAVSDDIGVEGYYNSRVAFKKAQFRETWATAIPYFGWKFWRLGEYYRRMLATNRHSSAKRQRRWDALLDDLRKQGFRGEIHSYEHGYNHACTAYYCSGFQDECLVFVMEAAGFINASSVYLGRNGRLEKILDIPWPHSPGRFYETITLLLGFRPARHEGKITGLAALGDTAVLGDYARDLFHLCDDRDDVYLSPLIHLWRWDYRRRKEGRALPKPLRNYSKEDIAAAWQMALEEALVGLVRRYLQRYPHIRRVALAGGVHGNVKLNQRINELEQVEDLYVHPGMSDCGQPVGAALACWAEREADSNPKPFRHETVYLGPAPDAKEIRRLTNEYQLVFEDAKNDDELAQRVADLLAANRIVALCRGRMEYGPRALGARTIMYAATDPSVNDWLNKQLKRTEFMPFAPVTLIEDAERCYMRGQKSAYTAGFMTVCYDCTDEMKKQSPAVVHVDGTARPQYISREQNPFYYDVLKKYKQRTGIPSVVNTSFNMHEEPIVCTAADALKAFVASNLDALVLEDRLLLKERNPSLREKLTGVHEVRQTPIDGHEPQD